MVRNKNSKISAPAEAPATPPSSFPPPGFPIIGIGASAGGLAAFESFFSAMPEDTDPGMAFVLVQHLAPDHKSILAELLKRYTRLQVLEVEDGMVVKPNCLYIIPPNRDMALLNGALQLLEPEAPRGQRLPIDYFFRSLALDLHERAIGVILSGTGSDGTLGARAIKGEGGMIMAQNLDSTQYDGMPRSAIATGLVDFVLPPDAMLPQLIDYAGRAYLSRIRPIPVVATEVEQVLKKLFVLLRTQTSHDFSQYKRNTILRRVERRMAIHRIEHLDDYLRYCQHNPLEINALFRDLLIGVTQFFRDPMEFQALQNQVLPLLLAAKPSGGTLRVWVPGCSSGEEAYSLAILLEEQRDLHKKHFKVQIFATDIDDHAIEIARSGVYPASIVADVPPERLTRFFSPEVDGSGYRVHKNIRDLLVFSGQDVIKDPPFSKLDLISCRNLMIYLEGSLQKKIIPLFHYALNPGGFLFLGTSESVGEFGELFTAVDRKAKLYQRKQGSGEGSGAVAGRYVPAMPMSTAPRIQPAPGEATLTLRGLTERALLQHYAAVAALVTEHGEILYLHGRTGRFLEPAPGEAGLNILKMAREGLRRPLTVALHNAVAQQQPIACRDLQVKTNGHFTTAHLVIKPVARGRSALGEPALYLVILEETPASSPADRKDGGAVKPEQTGSELASHIDERIATLEKELQAKDEYLQSSIEELETSNEELKSTNEEMQSVNEELQSTNEELETSKEELQSVNEELTTVNNELQNKMADLTRANNDMSNLLAGTDIGTIFVDHQLLIQRYTPAVTQIIHLIPGDVGRPVGHIVSNLSGYNTLTDDVLAVLDRLIPKEIEVQSVAGDWYLLRIRPYRTLENAIEGAVITFVDISEVKRAQALNLQNQSTRRLAAVVQDSRDAILMMALDGQILAWNPSAQRLYGWTEAEALSKNISELIPDTHRAEASAATRRLSQGGAMMPFATQRIARNGELVAIWLTATALVNEHDEVYAYATTERKQ